MKTLLFLFLVFNCFNTNAQRHYKAKLPPIPYRCTVDIAEGVQCPKWSVTDSEYCWDHVWRHECKYKHCPFKNQREFKKGCGACKKDSNCYKLDKIHFTFPNLSHYQCDSLLTNNPDYCNQL